MGMAWHSDPVRQGKSPGSGLTVQYPPCTAPGVVTTVSTIPPLPSCPFLCKPIHPRNSNHSCAPAHTTVEPMICLCADMIQHSGYAPSPLSAPLPDRITAHLVSAYYAVPSTKTLPVVFCRCWEALMRHTHLADPSLLAPIWVDLETTGQEEFQHVPNNKFCATAI